MNGQDIVKNLKKFSINDKKLLPKFLKWFGLIDSADKYEKFKHKIQISIVEWVIDYLIIRGFLISLILGCLSASGILVLPPIKLVLMAEGISITWYLIIDFKKELKGERNG